MTVENANPRVRRGEYGPWVGKKVVIGTKDMHYISGRVLDLDEDATLKIGVGDEEILLPSDHVESIQVAHQSQAEYVK